MRIGLVLNNLDEEYESTIFDGVRTKCMEKGISLFCLQANTYHLPGNPIYQLFPQYNGVPLDGLIFLASVILDNKNLPGKVMLDPRIKGVPAVAIAGTIKGYPTISVDARSTMTELMLHLTDGHGYKRFFYIGGPVQSEDNSIREKAVSDFIKQRKDEYNLTVVNGDLFTERSGRMAVTDYLTRHPVRDIDCIIAASDYIAIGASKQIRRLKIESWLDCPVTGFDDIPKAIHEIPPLTTIHQPLDKLGMKAVEVLVDIIRKIGKAETINVPAELVLRHSCGCRNELEILEDVADLELKKERQFLEDTNTIGGNFMSVNVLHDLYIPLRDFLLSLGINTFFLALFPENRQDDEHIQLIYSSTSIRERISLDNPEIMQINDFFRMVYNDENKSRNFTLFQLRAGDEILGFIVYPLEIVEHLLMNNSVVFLSNTLKRLQILEREKAYTEKLEKEVAARTKELEIEAKRRIEVEAEVLRISELERMRFSMDLHDDICQRLASLTMLCRNFSSSDPLMDSISKIASETLQKTREYAYNSFPMELDSVGLLHALKDLCRSVNEQHELSCNFDCSADIEKAFSRRQSVNIYRIIQEALHNSVAHAKASAISVEVYEDRQSIVFSISDNGTGNPDICNGKVFIENKRRPRSLGLRSMEYRSHQLEAEYKIKSSYESGTQIEVHIPIKGGDS